MYKYSEKSLCDVYDRDLSDGYTGYNELFRITEFKPNVDCGIHAVVKAVGHEDDAARRKIVIKTAYDGKLRWNAKAVGLKASALVVILGLINLN